MTLVCRTCTRVNPPEARFCYHDGAALVGGVGQGGPIAVGAQPFLSPFVFPSGRACRNFDELVLACEAEWEAAQELLYQGYLGSFLGGLGRADLALAARQATKGSDRDRGLDQFLNKLPSSTRDPGRLAVQPLEVNLGVLSRAGERRFVLHLENQGMGLLYGSAVCDNTAWLTLGESPGAPRKVFQFRHEFSLPVNVHGKALRASNRPLEGRLVIESNGGRALILVRAEVPVLAFPEGVLAGARTPRQIAEKAKANPKEAAVLFEKGAVAAWYEGNGWTYPVQGPASSGLGAVQQFFEALGLVTPPRVEISETSIQFRGEPGASLEHVLQVRTVEKRPVFAHATSGVPWLTVGRVQLDGRNARIPLRVPSVPALPGERLSGQVQVTANGNQRFAVAVALAVAGRPAHSIKPAAAGVFSLDSGRNDDVPVPSLAVPVSAPASPQPPPLPFDFSTPAAVPAEQEEPAVEVVSVPEGETGVRGRRRARPSGRGRRWVHLLPLAAIVLLLLGILGHDLLLPDEEFGPGGVLDPDPYIAVRFHDGPKDKLDRNRPGTMRFGVVMLREKDPTDPARLKRLTWDEWGRSNSTCVRVDLAEFLFGQSPGVWVAEKKRLTAGGEGLASSWALRPQKIEVTQEVQVVRGEQSGLLDTCLVRYVLENKDAVEHRVGIRFLLDTFIGANDGVPFTIPGASGLCDTKMVFDSPGRVPDFIQALEYEDLRNPGTVANVQFRLGGRLESPSKVILGGWPNTDLEKLAPNRYRAARADQTLWNVPVISMTELQQLAAQVGKQAPADSAVTMYWPEKPLAPGGRREVGFAYGLGKVSSNESEGKLLLTVGGQLTRNHDFTLTALVNNPRPGETLSLELPPGLTLVDGRREQAVPEVPPGAARPTSPVTWRVHAGREGSFKLAVQSSTGVKQTLPVRIRRQGVFD